jgi:prepilin-type N-terminal cleavage/methylation domain-containing protein
MIRRGSSSGVIEAVLRSTLSRRDPGGRPHIGAGLSGRARQVRRSSLRHDRDDGGFTLVEMIVCLGILALIASFSAEGLTLLRRGGVLIERIDREDALRAVQTHMRGAIESAEPVFASRDGAARLLFTGAADHLRLVTRSDPRLEGGGLVLASFGLEDETGGRALVTHRQALSPLPGGAGTPLRRILLDHVAALRFRYYGAPYVGQPAAWFDAWPSPNRLPQLIEVGATLGPEGSETWPAAVIAVPAAP